MQCTCKFRSNNARCHAIHTDIIAGQILTERLREAKQCRLAYWISAQHLKLNKKNCYYFLLRISTDRFRTGNGLSPAYDVMIMMLPPVFCCRNIGATSLANRNVALTLTSNILSHASSGQSKTDPTTGLTAAFETKMSIFLKLSKAALYSACRSAATETWHLTPITFFKPFCFNKSNALFTLSCFRLLITTFAPSCSKRSAVASPILISNEIIIEITNIIFWSDRTQLPICRCRNHCNFIGKTLSHRYRTRWIMSTQLQCFWQWILKKFVETTKNSEWITIHDWQWHAIC